MAEAVMDIPHDRKGTAGTWSIADRGDVFFRCPECGGTGTLDHSISENGDVSPSVECPHGCGFHKMVRLDGWPRELRRQPVPPRG